MTFSRRDFVKTSVLGAVAAGVGTSAQANRASSPRQNATPQSGSHKRPIILCANNGYAYVEAAYAFLKGGGDTLDAALHVVKGPEDDPNDDSVGLGGFPTKKAWSNSTPAACTGLRAAQDRLAACATSRMFAGSKAVMEHTGHVMLVGEGAERFAVAMGFPRENLLTERSRKIWLLWKEFNSDRDWWGPGMADPHWQARPAPNDKPQAELWQERIQQLAARAPPISASSRSFNWPPCAAFYFRPPAPFTVPR